MRPEDFEDAAVAGERPHGLKFNAKIDVLESMGSEYYAYFVVEADRVSTSELDELAQDSGSADLGASHGGLQVVARLDAASKVRQGQELELSFDTAHLHLFDPDSGESLLGGSPPSTAAAPSAPAAPDS
jgi:multiple sugar transport system ATP-binding protein